MGLDELTVDPSKFSTGEAAIRDAAGTREIQQSLNELAFSVAEAQFNQNLKRLDYDGGLFHVFEDDREVASKTDKLSFNGSISPFLIKFSDGTPTVIDHTDSVAIDVDSAPDGRLAWATGDSDDRVVIYEDDYSLDQELSLGGRKHTAVSFGPNGNVAIGASGRGAEVYDDTYSKVADLFDTGSFVRVSLAYGPNGQIAASKESSTLHLFDSNYNKIGTRSDPGGEIEVLAFDPNDGRLAVGAISDPNCYIYDNSFTLVKTLSLNREALDIDFDGNGNLAVSQRNNGTFIYDSDYNQLTEIGTNTELCALRSDGAVLTNTASTFEIYDSSFNLIENVDPTTDGPDDLLFDSKDGNPIWLSFSDTRIYERTKNSTVSVTLSDLDLSNDGFDTPPTDAVVSHDFTEDTDGSDSVEYTIEDQSGNSVVISKSETGDIVDVSLLQDRTVSIRVDVTDSDLNASLDGFAIHFNE